MNSAKTLYNILNAILILILIAIGVGVVLSFLVFFNVLPANTVSYRPDLMTYRSDVEIYGFFALMLMVYTVFTYGIWKLKEATKFLMGLDFYNIELIKRITISGKCMLLTGVFAWLIDGLSNIYFKQLISIGLTEKTFIYLFIMAMGLFMMLMGSVINDAKQLKQENELTI